MNPVRAKILLKSADSHITNRSSNGMKVKNNGFTTVELLIAIVVGAIIFASAGVLISNYSHLNNRGQNLILANSFVEAKAEALRSISYAGLNDGTTDISNELPGNLSLPKSASMTISEPSPGLKQADITVNFSDQGINRSYAYRTYVGELGVGQ